jgi:hypothetical protein
MRTLTIELPDSIVINSAGKAPEALRNVKTENWSPEFCLTALLHGVSQKIGDTWSVTKGDEEKTKVVHGNMEAGEWASRSRNGGVTEAKLLASVDKIDTAKLFASLSPGKLRELLDMQVQGK